MTNVESPNSRRRRTSGVSLNSATKLNGYGSMKANKACDGGDNGIPKCDNNNPDQKSITSELVCLASTGNQPSVGEKDDLNSSAENTPVYARKSKDTDSIIGK